MPSFRPLMKEPLHPRLLLLSAVALPSQHLLPDRLDRLDQFLHKRANLGIGLVPLMPVGEDAALHGRLILTACEAVAFAVYHLRKMGIKDIIICESRWIAAPLSGYLVDGLGSHVIDGKHFAVFRIGIRDGGEEASLKEDPYRAGTQFVFIALGWDSAGNPIWQSACGPDYHLSPDGSVSQGALSKKSSSLKTCRFFWKPRGSKSNSGFDP